MSKLKNIIILLSVFIVVISLSLNVFSESLPFFQGETCRCKEFCEAEMKCFFGDCSDNVLIALNCTNGAILATECTEPEYEICPACDIWENCIDHQGFFKDSTVCLDYYNFLVFRPECKQTINFNVQWTPNGKDFYDLTNPSIALGSTVEGVDYTYVFEAGDLEGRESNDFISIPMCNKYEDITVIAAKKGYDADINETTLKNDAKFGEIYINFVLPIGACHVDCTDSFGRCNSDCEGFTDGNDTCNFYNDTKKDVTKLCAYKPKGTEVILDISNDNYTVVNCCEGPKKSVFRPTSRINLVNGEDLISVAKPVKIGNTDQGELFLYYWN